MIQIRWKKLHRNAQIPEAASAGAACFDLKASLDADLVMQPGKIYAIPTGLSVEIPLGYELQVRARSGLALRFGMTLLNGIGTIDSDYRGEVKIIAMVLGDFALTIKSGERVAQALVSPVLKVEHVEVDDLSETERGLGGFGSTGMA